MKVTRLSPFSGEYNTREINITEEQLSQLVKTPVKWFHPKLSIQDFLPNLDADDRGFILTGITPDDWDNLFKE